MSAIKKYRVRIRDRNLGVMFDMLRYEQSNVVDWQRWTTDAEGDIGWLVTLQCKAPVIERWVSFGIHPELL